jgi:hypothetical protein
LVSRGLAGSVERSFAQGKDQYAQGKGSVCPGQKSVSQRQVNRLEAERTKG